MTLASALPQNVMVSQLIAGVMPSVVEWRRHLHEFPELSTQEKETAAFVTDKLKGWGYDVQTDVGGHGVVALLRGNGEGPTVALRADMDALPVTEETGLPFASKVRAVLDGREVGVAHACGHDAHTAMLLGAAQVLMGLRDEISGGIKFIFQPAEERGTVDDLECGAKLMIEEGVLQDPEPEAIYGLHCDPRFEPGTVGYRTGPVLAGSDSLDIVVRGRQTHGAFPWTGIDPIVVGAQIILALQALVGRQTNVVESPAVITIGSVHGGVKRTIIPSTLELSGDLRTFDTGAREDLMMRVDRTVRNIAAAAGASADIEISLRNHVTINDPELARSALPALRAVFGESGIMETHPLTGSEDFSWYGRVIPSAFFFLGVKPEGVPLDQVHFNHSPQFILNEEGLVYGVRTFVQLAMDFLKQRLQLQHKIHL